MTNLERVSRNKSFGGWQEVWKHDSSATNTPMQFGVYLPPQAEQGPCPVVYWLSGLTCTEQNFITKAAAQQAAAELGLIVIAPDTSPRGTDLPGEHEHWDFGSGAGFYVDATETPWSAHYRMDTYVTQELPALIQAHFPVQAKAAIMGHSMGGHGALVLGLRNREQYTSISAFAPISAPSECPWGQKAFGHYLGEEKDSWAAYDAHLLIQQAGKHLPLLIDQGSEDNFLKEGQLLPEKLQAAAEASGYALTLRYQEGYDHSFYFISTFIAEHLRFHAGHLQ
jgi:S-formylglutathione hydrolase